MASTNGFDPDHSLAGADDDGARAGWSVGRVLAAVAFLAVAGFWIWALSPLPTRTNSDSLQDETIRVRLEAVCAPAVEDIDDVPDAREATDMQDRADQVAAVTRRLETMLADMRSVVPADDPAEVEDDGELLAAWLDDWETFLGDREVHEGELRAGNDVRFAVTEVGGDQITSRIDIFADINGMQSCATPLDL